LLQQIVKEQKSAYQGSTEAHISTIDESEVLKIFMNALWLIKIAVQKRLNIHARHATSCVLNVNVYS